jgi:uncharacterized protein (TIGR00369 family)
MSGLPTDDMPPTLSRERLEAAIGKTPFAVLLGARLLNYSFGKAELSIPFQATITQHHGLAHGAILGFLADSACSWAAASVAGDVVTSEYKINLITPARGDMLIGRGEVIKVTGRQVITRADVFAVREGAETIVATALATIVKLKI